MARLQRVEQPSTGRVLSHILENPSLVAAVRELSGPVLGRLIDSVGLADASEIVALASTEQLQAVFDEDLWQSEDGGWDERFDPARFALWLHAFAEAGDDAVVERLTELPEDFVTLAVARLLVVVDLDALAMQVSEAGDGEEIDLVEKALESTLHEEWEEFRLIARDSVAWDDLVHALFALDRDHHALLRRILETCAALSERWIDEQGGLYSALSSDEMLEADVRGERDDRRARQGFVSPADARAFLELAKQGGVAPHERDAITRAYFRELGSPREKPRHAPPARRAEQGDPDVSGLMRVLEKARVVEPKAPSVHRALAAKAPGRDALASPSNEEASATRHVNAVLRDLRDQNPSVHAQRLDELSYLANVLMSAPRRDGRRLRPVEALEVAIATVGRGLELTISLAGNNCTPLEVMTTWTADQLFRRGYPEARAPSRLFSSIIEAPSHTKTRY